MSEQSLELIPRSEHSPKRYLNQYYCTRCAESWQDAWDCMCNDRCPVCNVETEPEQSDELDPEAEANLDS